MRHDAARSASLTSDHGSGKRDLGAGHVDRMHAAVEGDEQPLIAVAHRLLGDRILARIEERLGARPAHLVPVVVERDDEQRAVAADGKEAARAGGVHQAAARRGDLGRQGAVLDVDDAQRRAGRPVEDGHEAVVVRQRRMSEGHGIGGAARRDDDLGRSATSLAAS